MEAQLRLRSRYRLHLEALEDRTLLSIFTVDRLTDAGQGSGLAGDLRYCITQATSGQDSIAFSVTGTINLTRALPDLTTSVNITGPGADLLTVRRDTGGNYRIVTVRSAAVVAIAGLTLANGNSPIFAGGIYNTGTLSLTNCTITGSSGQNDGGGMVNDGTLTITNSTFSNNRVGDPSGRGGGILNNGTLTMSAGTVSANRANAGAGIYNNFSAVLTITNSAISSNSGADDGGGIYNGGKLSINNSSLANNAAVDSGGGILSQGTLTLVNSSITGNTISGAFGSAICILSGSLQVSTSAISNNTARAGYGAIYIRSATATLTASTVSGNTSLFQAGGIVNLGTLTVSGSTISGNVGRGSTAPPTTAAGGIFNSGTLTVSNSTITGNAGGAVQTAGGIATYAVGNSDATAMLFNATINGNTVSGDDRTGSQLYSGRQGTGTGKATAVFRNTILSGGGSRPVLVADLGGTLSSQGHNLSSDGGSGFLTSPGDLVNANPLLDSLQNNGGPTLTIALLSGSPAVDAGDNTNAPDFDQRGPGFPRIVGGVTDIGAFEVQPGPATHLQLDAPARVTSNMPFGITVTALDAFNHTATGYLGTVTFTSTDTDPGVLLPLNYTFVPADSGAHVFPNSVSLRTAGSQTVTAADVLLPSIKGNTSVVVSLPLFLVTTTLDSGAGSLRQAILDADAIPGPNTIRFAIGMGTQTIAVASPLPAITLPVILDGTTQPGYSGTPLIELSGAGAGPGADGLLIIAGSSVVRGLVINGFSLNGIELQNGGGNILQGNYIGTDITGTLALGNGIGVRISSSNNIIGGPASGAGNVIAGNLGDGISISNGTSNVLQGNLIGTNARGTNLGNFNNGVHLLSTSGNTIGGTTDGAANIIAYDGNDGVLVDAGSGNGIERNSIYSHTSGLGIELVNGGNNRLPFPVLLSASSDGLSTTVQGLLQSTPNTAMTLEFFANLVCNPSGFGEGQQFLGSMLVTTNSHGTASFMATFATAVPPDQFIAATATDPANNTSAFSNCVNVANPPVPPMLVPPSPKRGIGETVFLEPNAPHGAIPQLASDAAVPCIVSRPEGKYQELSPTATAFLFETLSTVQARPAETRFASFLDGLHLSSITDVIRMKWEALADITG